MLNVQALFCVGEGYHPSRNCCRRFYVNVYGRGVTPPLRGSLMFYSENIGCFFVFSVYTKDGGDYMKEKETAAPIPWEMKDPKPPVVQSGHMESRVQHNQGQ